MGAKTHYLENAIINHVYRNTPYTAPTTVYVGLFTSAPSDAYTAASPDGVECTGGSYARVAATFAAPSSGSTSNSSPVSFPTSTGSWGGVVTHFATFESATGGEMLEWAALSLARTVDAAGITLSYGTGELIITED